MKAIFIVFNQVLSEEIIEILNNLKIRGFTKFNDLEGRGTNTGDPHMGSHSWPALNNGILVVIEENRVASLQDEIEKINQEMEEQGIRLFGWKIDEIF
jgi:hypothetical protein